MEKENRNLTETWEYIDYILCRICPTEWEQLTPPEKELIKVSVTNGNVNAVVSNLPTSGMFCFFSASFENMYFIVSIVYMLVQTIEIYRLKSQRVLTEKEIEDLINNAIQEYNKKEQIKIRKLLSSKINKLKTELRNLLIGKGDIVK